MCLHNNSTVSCTITRMCALDGRRLPDRTIAAALRLFQGAQLPKHDACTAHAASGAVQSPLGCDEMLTAARQLPFHNTVRQGPAAIS